MFNTLNKKIFEDKFINLLVEKRVHPSCLLKLTQELDAEKVINEAWHNKIEQPKHGSVFGALGRGLTGALGGALKGGLRGLVQGLQTGYGSAPIETSKAQLKSDLKSAYTEFSNKIERITGDSGLAHIIFTNLNQNVDSAATVESSNNAMKAIRSPAPSFDTNGNLLAQNSSANVSSNRVNSSKNIATEDYPPCPAPQRCPEPNFDCKKVPKYEQGPENPFLPRPVLTDFSTFGM
jgi:hypothetical protein